MATISDPFVLISVPSHHENIDVNTSGRSGCVTVTRRSRCVEIVKVEDQKTVQSWSLRHGVQFSGPVVYSSTVKSYVGIHNRQDIWRWPDDLHNLDKAKKRHVECPVQRVFSLPGVEPMVLFENGHIEFLSSIKQQTAFSGCLSDEKLLWEEAVKCSESTAVVCLLSKTKEGTMKVYFCRFHDGQGWAAVDVTLPLRDDNLCCCCIPTSETVHVYSLCSNGDLYCTSERTRSCVKVLNLPGVDKPTVMVAARESHVAVAGVKKDSSIGLGIFDVKFGSLLAWKQFPEENSSVEKIFVVDNNLFVPCGQALYCYEFTVEWCSLAGALGSFNLMESSTSDDNAVSLTWKVGNPKVTKTPSGEIMALFDQLNNRSKTVTAEDFQKVFNRLMVLLQKPEYQQFWTSPHMSLFIKRSSTETKFWPREELLRVIKEGFVPPSVMAEFYEAMIERSDLVLLHASICHLQDIPEAQMVKTLQVYLSCKDQDFGEVCDKIEDQQHTVNDDNMKCPFGPGKVLFVNAVLAKPYNDVFLLECLQSITFEHVLVLMQYLHYVLSTSSGAEKIRKNHPSLLQVVDWLCLLVDAHATQLILSPDARPILVDLHELVQLQMKFYDELISLEAVLSQLKEKCAPVKQKSVGMYCIEVLCIR